MARERKLSQQRKLLLDSVRTHLLPALMQQGFMLTPLVLSGPVDREFAATLPFNLLHRMRPDGGVDLVEIQFKTYRRAAFRINARAVPKEETMAPGGHRAVGELEAGGLCEHFEMYASPRWRRWFSLRFWWLRTPVPSKYDRLALQVAALLPEVELALREGKLGPHMRKVVFSLPSLSE